CSWAAAAPQTAATFPTEHFKAQHFKAQHFKAQPRPPGYREDMEVTLTEFKASLAKHLDSVKGGEDVIITNKGVPVARLTSVESSDLLTSLVKDGLVTVPAEDRAVPRLPQAEAAKDALSSLLGRLRR